MGPLVTGVVVVLLFSVAWPIPIRSVNGFLCLGVILGGFVAGMVQAKANDNTLESTRGLKLGARVGFTAALIIILVDLLFEYVDFGQGARAGIDVLDPIPKYIYAAIYGIWDGLLDLVSRDEGPDGLEWPGRIARYIILVVSTSLFGSFGGGIAASAVESPSMGTLPEDRPDTPVTPGWMRPGQAIVHLQDPQEAQIFQPPERARPAAATGTYGPTDPRWVQAGQQPQLQPQPQAVRLASLGTMPSAPVRVPPATAASYPTPTAGYPTSAAGYRAPTSGYPAPTAGYPVPPPAPEPKPGWEPETLYTSQPFFDEAAQMQSERRPGGSVLLTSTPAAPVKSESADPS